MRCSNCNEEEAVVQTSMGLLGEGCLNVALAQGYDPESDPKCEDLV